MLKTRCLLRPNLTTTRYLTTNRTLNPTEEKSLNENCLLVDTNDKVIGSATKKECHFVKPGGELLLHRAFSVLLFNSKQELMLQKRSAGKITFPGCFSTTCCSHPLADYEDEKIEDNALGIKLAAIRRLNHELGVPKDAIKPDDLTYLMRIIYKSLGDGTWGEHEIAYILLCQKDVTVKPNPHEVSEVKLLPRDKLDSFYKNLEDPVTPWFHLYYKNGLKLWWENINRLDRFIDHKTIQPW